MYAYEYVCIMPYVQCTVFSPLRFARDSAIPWHCHGMACTPDGVICKIHIEKRVEGFLYCFVRTVVERYGVRLGKNSSVRIVKIRN